MSNLNKGELLASLLRQAEGAGDSSKDGQEKVIDLGNDFDFSGFQVVRREFFAHTSEPSVSFCDCKFYVNNACLQKFSTSDFIQVLINKESKIMALMPCPEGARDSFQWCSLSGGKRKPKQITCKLFFAKIVDLMKWNPDYRYKMIGKLIHANGETLIAFDLNATEVYQRTIAENKKVKTSRTPVFPAEWQNQFGLPYDEHREYMQINIFDGYAIYSIKENAAKTEQQPHITSAPVPDPSKINTGVLANSFQGVRTNA